MALEAVVFSQDLYTSFGGGIWTNGSFQFPQIPHDFPEKQTENFPFEDWNSSSSVFLPIPSPEEPAISRNPPLEAESRTPNPIRPRKRRPKSRKNKEDIENQRMTHIAVERNRRKQMNEYLSVLRSLMPESYVQRGDQASIIGGAINFVKELEQQVQVLSTMETKTKGCSSSKPPFSEFFTFPQFKSMEGCCSLGENETQCSSIADIEVTMVENHANLKIRSKRRPKQALKIVAGLHSLCLSVLHLNISTINQIVLYCLSVKVEDDCKLNSVDEIASALHQLLCRIEEESVMN
ncbi:Transcription factor basic helix-loop-helix 96, partial [Cucurbita argyrosperma subsp. sororia]